MSCSGDLFSFHTSHFTFAVASSSCSGFESEHGAVLRNISLFFLFFLGGNSANRYRLDRESVIISFLVQLNEISRVCSPI